MRQLLLILGIFLAACQTTREKNALLLHDRVEQLAPKAPWKPVRCEVIATLSASQKAVYRAAFPDETELVNDGQVKYDWAAGLSKCQVHAHPLTPMTANQRTLVEEALCTLIQVFWIHSPFDDLKVSPDDMVDEENVLFLKQKPESDVGLYLDKSKVSVETKTAKRGTYAAVYQSRDGEWVPGELRHGTSDIQFVVKDLTWETKLHRPPTSLWILVGQKTEPQRHTKLDIQCP